MQLFWLTMLGAVRAAAGTGDGGAQLPAAAPGANGSAMVDKLLSELEQSCDRRGLPWPPSAAGRLARARPATRPR